MNFAIPGIARRETARRIIAILLRRLSPRITRTFPVVAPGQSCFPDECIAGRVLGLTSRLLDGNLVQLGNYNSERTCRLFRNSRFRGKDWDGRGAVREEHVDLTN